MDVSPSICEIYHKITSFIKLPRFWSSIMEAGPGQKQKLYDIVTRLLKIRNSEFKNAEYKNWNLAKPFADLVRPFWTRNHLVLTTQMLNAFRLIPIFMIYLKNGYITQWLTIFLLYSHPHIDAHVHMHIYVANTAVCSMLSWINAFNMSRQLYVILISDSPLILLRCGKFD